MSFVLFKTPPVIKEYSPDDGDVFQRFLDEILNGSIASNLKSMVLRDFNSVFDSLLQEWEKSYSEVLASYEFLSKILVSVMRNSGTYEKMETNYSTIFEANFRYALGVLVNIVQLYYTSIKAQGMPKQKLPESLVLKVKESYSQYVIISTDEMPDASTIFSKDDDFKGLLAMILLAFNFTLFAALIIVTVMITEVSTDLSSNQIEEIETTLRDWTQEFSAQSALILRKSLSESQMFGLTGILSDDEDFLLTNEDFEETE